MTAQEAYKATLANREIILKESKEDIEQIESLIKLNILEGKFFLRILRHWSYTKCLVIEQQLKIKGYKTGIEATSIGGYMIEFNWNLE